MVFPKSADYGQNAQKQPFVRKNSAGLARFYGQITEKCRFVRKMRFAYGQISKIEGFVRKFE